MRKEFFPYYLSRAVLSCGFSVLVFGFTWKALLLALGFFAVFLIYLHSGWFQVDLSHPLIPLRRDARGLQAQRVALIAAVAVGLVIDVILARGFPLPGLPVAAGNLALALGIVTYFITQFILLARA